MPSFKILLAALLFIAAKTGAQTTTVNDSASVDVKIFNKVEVEASFPGGASGWRDFLVKNLNASTPVNHGAPAGKYMVIVRFIVAKDGSLSNITAETNIGYGMEQELIRILKKSGNWIPASNGNRNVNAYRRQPVTFIVEEDGFTVTSKEPYTLYTDTENILTVSFTSDKMDVAALTMSVDGGTAEPLGPGRFIVKVNEPGRVLVTLYYTGRKKPILLGVSSFTVLKKSGS